MLIREAAPADAEAIARVVAYGWPDLRALVQRHQEASNSA